MNLAFALVRPLYSFLISFYFFFPFSRLLSYPVFNYAAFIHVNMTLILLIWP